MTAIEEQKQAPGIKLGDITDALKRRFWILVLTTVIGTAIATGVAFVLPPVYSATAHIQVNSQQIPSRLAASTVTASARERLALIQQRLMTRENLLDLVQRLNLYQNRPNMTAGQKVALLRANTQIYHTRLGGNRNNPRLTSFAISFTADRPALTARVANEFVTMVLEQNLRTRSERASETHDFFRKEVERLTAELLAVESEITAFKNDNALSLPDGLAARQRGLTNMKARVFEREQRKIALEDRLKDLQILLQRGPDENSMTFEERELRKLERALVRERALKADSHPVVRALLVQITEMKKVVAAQLGQDNDEELDLRKVQAQREDKIRRRIAILEGQVANIDQQNAEDQGRIAELEKALDKAPQVEMALIALNRRHADLRGQYKSAVDKQAAAATGEKLEVNRQAERFEVIEQAQVPDRPIKPNREMIAGGGLAGSIALGLVLIGLVEFLNSAIRTPADLERRFGMRPLATVPYIHTGVEVGRRRRRFWMKLLFVVVVVPGALFAVDQYYLPLSVLMDKFLARTGLEQVVDMIRARF